MALLQVIRGLNPGQQFPLEGKKAILGRHPDCDIVVDVGAVSRQHAQITREDDDYYVEDLKSRNGTFVNGQITQGRHKLLNNDRLRICDVLFTFYQGAAPAPSASLTGSEVGTPPRFIVEDTGEKGTTIMSTLDIQSGVRGTQLIVNPEMKLKAIMEIAKHLRTTLSLEEVLKQVLESLFKIFTQADRGFVILQNSVGVLVPMAVKHRRPDAEESARVSKTIVSKAMATGEAILSADAATDSRFDTSQSIADFRIRSMMCVPLMSNEAKALGVIQIDTLDQRSRFTQDDLEVLAHVAILAATAIENAQLHEAALAKRAIDRDLELAHKVQQGILPGAPPNVPGYSFFDYYEPARQVGGDYFDYVTLPGNRLGIIVADVSGKGVSAALVMARLSSEARYALASHESTADAMQHLNASFARAGWEDRFVTMILAVLDLEHHSVTFTNAGHMAPRLRHAADRPDRLELIGDAETGLPLGVTDDFQYEQTVVKLAPGDSLTMFTDGFSEAMDAQNQIYGLQRLDKQLSASAQTVKELGDQLLEDVKRFAGTRAQADDMCLLCFGRA